MTRPRPVLLLCEQPEIQTDWWAKIRKYRRPPKSTGRGGSGWTSLRYLYPERRCDELSQPEPMIMSECPFGFPKGILR